MFSKRVMLVGALVVGVSYILAIERVSVPGSDTHLASPGDPDTSVNAAQAQPLVQQPQAARQADARVGRQLAELANGMAQLKTELTTLRDGTQPADTVAPPMTAEQVQAQHDEYMAGVERAFEREARDEQWATGTSQVLRETLASEPVMLAAVRGIECRSSSCRMEIRDDGSSAFAEEFPLMVHEMGAVLPEVRFGQSALADGAQLHILYMTKAADEP